MINYAVLNWIRYNGAETFLGRKNLAIKCKFETCNKGLIFVMGIYYVM